MKRKRPKPAGSHAPTVSTAEHDPEKPPEDALAQLEKNAKRIQEVARRLSQLPGMRAPELTDDDVRELLPSPDELDVMLRECGVLQEDCTAGLERLLTNDEGDAS